MTQELKQFTINRATWLRGEGGPTSSLMRPRDGKMCCLGFLGLACGVPAEELQYQGHFSSMSREARSVLPPGFVDESLVDGGGSSFETAACNYIILVNDATHLSDADRELYITFQLVALGIEVKFEG